MLVNVQRLLLISLLAMVMLSGCIPVDRTPRNLLPVNSFAHMQTSLQSVEFMKITPSGIYRSEGGVDIWHFIKHLEASQIIQLSVRPSSTLAMELSLEFKEYWEMKNKTVLYIKPLKHFEENSVSSIQIEIQRSMLSLSPCMSNPGQYLFGCAVNSNRALSLVNYSELQIGGKLGSAIAVFEERSLQKIIDNNSNDLIGDTE